VYKSNQGKLLYNIYREDRGRYSTVTFIPFDSRPNKTLSRKIAHNLRPNIPLEIVSIYNCDDNYPQFHVRLEEGFLSTITWNDTEAYTRSFGRKKRGACIGEQP
jgi:hypothetical protein